MPILSYFFVVGLQIPQQMEKQYSPIPAKMRATTRNTIPHADMPNPRRGGGCVGPEEVPTTVLGQPLSPLQPLQPLSYVPQFVSLCRNASAGVNNALKTSSARLARTNRLIIFDISDFLRQVPHKLPLGLPDSSRKTSQLKFRRNFEFPL